MTTARPSLLVVLLGLTALPTSGCLSNAPRIASPSLRVTPGQSALLERDAWHFDPRPGDRYAVAGQDLRFADRMVIGPPDDPSGRCVMRPDGDVEVKAPWTSGHWPCLLRVCRDECMIARFIVVSEPVQSGSGGNGSEGPRSAAAGASGAPEDAPEATTEAGAGPSDTADGPMGVSILTGGRPPMGTSEDPR